MSKISLSPNASGTGTFTIASPNSSTDRTLTLPDSTGTVGLVSGDLGTPSALILTNATGLPASALPTGSVLQVVQTVKTDTFSTSSTISSNGTSLVNTGAEVTGLSASITPSSSSNKVLVRVTFYGCGTSTVGQLLALLYRGTTVIGNAAQSSTARPGVNARATYVAATSYDACVTIEYLDSPATTSSTTYKVNVGSDTGTVYVGRTQNDGNAAVDARTPSIITLMEIKG